MTTGPENLGNGAAKTEDRFAGPLGYRPRGNRDGGPLSGPLSGAPLSGGPLSSAPLSGGSLSGPLDGATDEFGPRNGGSGLDRIATPLDIANPIASTLTQPKLAEPALAELREPTLGEAGYREDPYRENGYRAPAGLSTDSWLDAPSVVDHPLLRGLLLELPPKGSTLRVQWLDRWFEAARSILELLYRFEDGRG
jgi:hypothetical protein